MDQVLAILAKLPEYLGMISAVIVPLIAVFMVVPGEQPEKFLQSVLDFIKKLSKK